MAMLKYVTLNLKVEEENKPPRPPLVCFTDGSCSDQTKKKRTAGYSVVWPDYPEHDIAKPLEGDLITNNRAEYMALVEAINVASMIDDTGKRPLTVYTDSELLINSVTKWLFGWKKNNWRKADKQPVANQDLLKIIDALLPTRDIRFKHVKAHTGRRDWESTWNDVADKRAKAAHFATN
jgi:ribonuclease HI